MTSATSSRSANQVIAIRLTLRGKVQGIGMRPAIARWATQLGIVGHVLNCSNGVEIHVQGPGEDVGRFVTELSDHLPDAAVVDSLDHHSVAPIESDSFLIEPFGSRLKTKKVMSPGDDALATVVPPDVVSCEACLGEVGDPSDRRAGYPFASCDRCGPRYSIITEMPFQRSQTGMAAFPLCVMCRADYESSADRRFFAQTIACPECGPQIWATGSAGNVIARGREAIQVAGAALDRREVVAIRGLGGYQLLVDAKSESAVSVLRQRKGRYSKPLAVMVASLEQANQVGQLGHEECQVLASRAGPIVIVALRQPSEIVPAVLNQSSFAASSSIGLMLPTTPLHQLLLDTIRRPLVCTSGNLEGEPICYEVYDSMQRLASVADLFLHHNRPIIRPIDDSVVRVIADQPVVFRSARGYSPRLLELPGNEPMLALGAQQKAAIALNNGQQAILGPHIGNLDDAATRDRWRACIEDLTDLYQLRDYQRIADLHPDYFASQWLDENSHSCLRVQHHHAHIAAGMLEHGWLDREVLGIAMDGAGYGSDGVTWGGEFMVTTAHSFRRVGHVRAIPLVGGDRAAREPWRVATALVHQALGDQAAAGLQFQDGQSSSLLPVLDRPSLAPSITSTGRLFDGVAALTLGIERSDFDGHAAMMLESTCDLAERGAYPLHVTGDQFYQLDWRPLVKRLMADRESGVAPGTMAMRFHRGLATAIFCVARYHASLPVVLGGGVFQNRVLVELLVEMLAKVSQPLRFPNAIPPGDGGLAAGQLAVASSLRGA